MESMQQSAAWEQLRGIWKTPLETLLQLKVWQVPCGVEDPLKKMFPKVTPVFAVRLLELRQRHQMSPLYSTLSQTTPLAETFVSLLMRTICIWVGLVKPYAFILLEEPAATVGSPILPLAQESMEMNRRPQWMGWGMQVVAGPITVCLEVAAMFTGKCTAFNPNIAASMVKSTAQRADTKALVIPSIPSRLDSLASVMMIDPVLVLSTSPLVLNRLLRQFLQLFQSSTSATVQLVNDLKMLHLTVKNLLGDVTWLKVASHSGPASSVMPGPQNTWKGLFLETVSISLTKLLAVQLGSIPLDPNLSAQSKSSIGTGYVLDPMVLMRVEKQLEMQVLKAALVKSLLCRSKPMLTLLRVVGPEFLQKAEMRVMMAEQSQVQVPALPIAVQAEQLYLYPTGYCILREMPKLLRAEPNRREMLTMLWNRVRFMLEAQICAKLQLSPAILLGNEKVLSWQFLVKSTVERMLMGVVLAVM